MAIAAQARHWRVFAPLAAVLVLFVLWSGYWWWGSGEAVRRVEAVRVDLERQGLDVACASESLGGYPFRYSFTCTGLDIAAGDGSRASFTGLEVLAQAWDPRHLILLIEGPLRLVRPDGAVWTITHAPAVASLVMRRGGAQVSLLAEQVAARGPAGATLAAGRLNLHVRLPEAGRGEGAAPGTASADVALDAHGLDLAGADRQGLRIDALEAEAHLSALPLPLAGGLRAALRAAAAAGAQFSLTRFAGRAEGIDADAAGSVRLLATGLPEGRIAVHVGDVKQVFARLAERGVMAPRAADGAAVVVGLMTAAEAAGGRPGSVDLLFRDGSVFWGPFRLVTHGPLF